MPPGCWIALVTSTRPEYRVGSTGWRRPVPVDSSQSSVPVVLAVLRVGVAVGATEEAVVLEGALCGPAQDVLIEPVLPTSDDHGRVIRRLTSSKHEKRWHEGGTVPTACDGR